MYHAHYGLQRTNGLIGMIQVSLPPGVSEPYTYDDEKSIILTDWYHESTFEQATGLLSIPFGWVNEPQVQYPVVLHIFSTKIGSICSITGYVIYHVDPNAFYCFAVAFDTRKRELQLLNSGHRSRSLQCHKSRMLSLCYDRGSKEDV